MKNEGKEVAASVTVSLPTRFQGAATIQALPRVSSLSLLSLSPLFCQMFQWRSQPDGETPSPAFSLVFPPPPLSLSLSPRLSPCSRGGASPTFPCTIFSLFPSCLPLFLSVSLPFPPLSLRRRYMWADYRTRRRGGRTLVNTEANFPYGF